MLWGVPWSSLSKAIVNGLPAGAVNVVSTNAMPLAWIWTSAAPPAGGGPPRPAASADAAGRRTRPAAAPRGAGRAGRATRAGAPLASPIAKADDLEDGRADDQDDQAAEQPRRRPGSGMLSRWPVVSARPSRGTP